MGQVELAGRKAGQDDCAVLLSIVRHSVEMISAQYAALTSPRHTNTLTRLEMDIRLARHPGGSRTPSPVAFCSNSLILCADLSTLLFI